MKWFISFLYLTMISFMFVPSSLVAEPIIHPKTKVLILIGAPGSGKGTQCLSLVQKLSIPQISTGELFRDNLKNNSLIGQKTKTYMDRGELVPDDIVLEMLFDRLDRSDCQKGYLLDGFPRTIPQAKALSNYLNAHQVETVVFSLEVPDALILERLSGRWVCKCCSAPYHNTFSPPQKEGICDQCGDILIQRNDDKIEVIRNRLAIFHEQTAPLKNYYQEIGSLFMIDGSQPKEIVAKNIENLLTNTAIQTSISD